MRRLKTLIKKEIMDILRDKKTLVMMVAVPLLLYPTIMIGMTIVISMMAKSQENTVHIVGYEGSPKETEVVGVLKDIYEENKEELSCELSFEQMDEENVTSEEEKTGEADVWLTVSETGQGRLYAEIDYTSTKQDSDYAQRALSELLSIYKENLLTEELTKEGLTEEFLHPIKVESVDSASESESMGMSIGGSLGMMLVITIMTGAFYPAVDITTGEKERGTLETLLTLPVSNFQMIMSKYIAVSLFACTTALLSLLALGGSVLFLLFGLSAELSGELQGMEPVTILTVIPVLLIAMITTALLVTAVCMCFCVFAKSVKEANNYSTAVMLIIMFASMIGMMPSAELNFHTALIPFVNISLLVKQIAAQQLAVSAAGITILVNLAYSVLIIWILAKMYDSEDILFHDGFRNLKLFQKRKNIEKGTVPDAGDLVIGTVIVLLLMLYLGTAVSVRSTFLGTVVSQCIILTVPLFIVWYMKTDMRRLFCLNRPKKGTVMGSVLLYMGTFCLEMAATGILVRIFPESTKNQQLSYDAILEQPVWGILFVMALMPAVGEEIFFRGFLYGGFRHKYGSKWGILISAFLFGTFHMSLVKLLPTAMLGGCFACIISVSGSIYIGMALHFVNNAFLMLQMKKPETVGKLLPVLMKEELTTADMLGFLAVGVFLAAMGLCLLFRKRNDAGYKQKYWGSQ